MKPAKDHYVVNIASFVVALIGNRSDSTYTHRYMYNMCIAKLKH